MVTVSLHAQTMVIYLEVIDVTAEDSLRCFPATQTTRSTSVCARAETERNKRQTQWFGSVVPWCRGAVVPWFQGAVVPWCRGAVVPWFRDSVVP